jgi:hypothetical protein
LALVWNDFDGRGNPWDLALEYRDGAILNRFFQAQLFAFSSE